MIYIFYTGMLINFQVTRLKMVLKSWTFSMSFIGFRSSWTPTKNLSDLWWIIQPLSVVFLELYLGGEKKKFGVYWDAKKTGDVEENT